LYFIENQWFMKVNTVLETCLCVNDIDAAEAFYTNVLGMEAFAKQPGRHVFFRCENAVFLLFNAAKTSDLNAPPTLVNGSVVPPHGTTGAGHVAFRCQENELPGWRIQLEKAGVEIESEVEWPGGGKSIYFRDPSGNCLELATPAIWGFSED
jgi:catechol 2,3-dioxygenase-like lactoylglutathione lyase family enzyme